ncbi:MAG TPA: carbohydrate kinase family protein [Steroidobacteraceae bacterium]|nr:carbohydrate kinase family protein [Steroidobacteraceae bacterium]
MQAPVVKAGKALICGSMAFDTIMVFQDQFKNHLLPDKLHMLNVSFLVPQLRREFGGCAGNIAYNLRLLGDPGYVMATVGKDFAPYAEWMDSKGVPRTYLRQLDDEHTGQAFITTDLDNNQITAFHPGAMGHSHLNKVGDASGVALGIVAPDGRDGMIQHAEQFAAAGIPFIFDPGQGLPMFGGDDLRTFIGQATWVTVNEYEWSLMAERTGWNEAEVARRVAALIVTKGGEGSTVYTEGREISIPTAPARSIVDPTGCGDAYRAGIIHGLLHRLPWEQTGRVASLLGSIKIESRGTQNHSFTIAEFKKRYQNLFGSAIDIAVHSTGQDA